VYTIYTNTIDAHIHIMRKGYGTVITLPPKQMGLAIEIKRELEHALTVIPQNAHPVPF
jgi:hypothetical protein